MRVGLLGPAAGDGDALREAIEFLIGDVEVEKAIYLGEDAHALDEVLAGWAREIFGEEPSEEAFLRRALEVATEGSAADIELLLESYQGALSLARVHALPPPPARAVEMLGDRMVIVVHDKSILDEEDIANADLIVYGRAREADLKRFGTRYFLTPGPLQGRRVAVLEAEGEESISMALFETTGVPVWREAMARRSGKMSVTS